MTGPRDRTRPNPVGQVQSGARSWRHHDNHANRSGGTRIDALRSAGIESPGSVASPSPPARSLGPAGRRSLVRPGRIPQDRRGSPSATPRRSMVRRTTPESATVKAGRCPQPMPHPPKVLGRVRLGIPRVDLAIAGIRYSIATRRRHSRMGSSATPYPGTSPMSVGYHPGKSECPGCPERHSESNRHLGRRRDLDRDRPAPPVLGTKCLQRRFQKRFHQFPHPPWQGCRVEVFECLKRSSRPPVTPCLPTPIPHPDACLRCRWTPVLARRDSRVAPTSRGEICRYPVFAPTAFLPIDRNSR